MIGRLRLAIACLLVFAACTPEKNTQDAGKEKEKPTAMKKQKEKNAFSSCRPEVLGKIEKGVTHLAFSSGGDWLAATARGGELVLWRKGQSSPTRRIRAHDKPAMSAAFSPDGKLVATAGHDQTAKIWDLATGKLLKTFKDKPPREKDMTEEEMEKYAATPPPLVNWVAFSANGKQLVTAGDDFALKVWDVSTGKKLKTIEDFGCRQNRVMPRPDGKPGWLSIAACADDGVSYLKFWSPEGQLEKQAGDARHDAHFVAIDPQRRFIAAADGSLALTIFSTQGSQLRRILLPGYHFCTAFGRTGKYLAIGAGEGKVWVLEAGTWKRSGTIDSGVKTAVDALAVEPGAGRLVAGLRDGSVVAFSGCSLE